MLDTGSGGKFRRRTLFTCFLGTGGVWSAENAGTRGDLDGSRFVAGINELVSHLAAISRALEILACWGFSSLRSVSS